MKKITTFYIVCIISVMNIYSQKSKLDKADKEYGQLAYVDAIKTYERVFEKGYKSVDMLQKLGNAYYFKADLVNAANIYGELFALTSNLESEYYYRYAQSLKAIKKYDKADEMMAKFKQLNGGDSRGRLAAEQKDYLTVIKNNSGRYTVENAGINTEFSDFGASFLGDKVVFTSAKTSNKVYERKNASTGESYTNLYIASKEANGTLSNAQPVSKNINSRYNESTPIFTKDGKTVYFTRNNYLDKKGKNEAGTILLKIYQATFIDGKWNDVTELPFNSDEYSVAHPALSPDEKFLYFSSNMPGTLGQSDIFRTTIHQDGTYGAPENLGVLVNTEGRETFPFISADNELYFASDGHPGLGGLDVFVSKADRQQRFKYVQNVGETVNSSTDDFGLVINSTSKQGYFSSNRAGGKGSDDIYKFKELKKLTFPCEQFLEGTVTDKTSGMPVANARVTLFDKDYKIVKVISADQSGTYDFGQVDCNAQYHIKAEKQDYHTNEITAVIGEDSGITIAPITLDKIVIELKLGDDLAIVLKLEAILFDLNKSNIRPDAAVELAKILDVMQQNPAIKVDIRSHTDSRNSADYNKKLSDRRAKSTMDWLVNNGIDKSSLSAKGYGESQLLNKCADGVKCSEEEHQVNRRSEFIIIK